MNDYMRRVEVKQICLLSMLGLQATQVPRIREVFYHEPGHNIVIRTRTGGGNRDAYEDHETALANFPEEVPMGPFNSDLRDVEGFVSDEDDDYDSTYAYFTYTAPAGTKEVLEYCMDFLEAGFSSEVLQGFAVRSKDSDQLALIEKMLEILKLFEGDLAPSLDTDG